MAEQPVQRFYWPENAIDWPEVQNLYNEHAWGQKLQRFRLE